MNPVRFSRRAVLLGSAAAALAGPALAQSDASERLRRLFARSDEAELRRNPLSALSRGDMRYAGKLGDLFTDSHDAAGRHNALRDLNDLSKIDRSALSPDEQVAYDVFKWQRDLDRRALSGALLRADRAMAVNHFYGVHASFAQLSSGQGSAPFKTLGDYENGLKRLRAMPAVFDRVGKRLRRGAREGMVLPRVIVNNVVEQLDAMVGPGVEASAFYTPIKAFPADIAPADRARLAAAYGKVIGERLLPALARLRDYMRGEYLPQARDTVGLLHMKGGPELYRFLVEAQTTTPMDPEEVHQLGLSEVARIQGEIRTVMTKVGFRGTLLEFFDHIRTDPKFKPTSKQQMIDGFTAIGARVAPNLPRLFGHLPRTRLEIRPTPELTEKGAARGSYDSGTPDGSRPGVFYFNTYDLPSRSIPTMETLYLHEGAPGHHFQISLAQENEALPAFMRFDLEASRR